MTRILTLMDNTAGSALTVPEHGLSFLIEREGRTFLFDTGKTGSFLDNAHALACDVGRVEAIAVSHGHYDHGGGVRSLCERTGFSGPLWTGAGFFDAKWSDEPGGPRYLGVDFDEGYLATRGITHNIVSAPEGTTMLHEVLPGIFVVNGFPRIHAEERLDPRFVVDRNGARSIDDFRDEVCVVITTEDGLAVVLGCAHRGLMNMLDAVRAAFDKPIRAVFGGSHLVDADSQRIEATVSYLVGLGSPLAALGHCTGVQGAEALALRLASFRPLSVGAEFRL